jgi:carbon-monoxide dehydrogenase medium subunit
MREFYRGPYETAVGHGELLTELRFPVRPRSGSAYEKVGRRVGDWAIVAAGAAVVMGEDGRLADVSIGVTAVNLPSTATRAEDAIRGERPDEAAFAAAAAIVAADCAPVEDQRGPVDYKRHLAAELTRRVLRTATARATAR